MVRTLRPVASSACESGADFVTQVRETGYAGQYAVEIFNAQYRVIAARAVAERAMRSVRAVLTGIETG